MARATFDPETRLLYGESLQAPPGHRFDGGVATTFSMDFATALAVPVSLALFAAENRDEVLSHPIALLEGAERIAETLAVYVDAGQIHAERGVGNRLCSLLERVVVEVQAPGGGSFHPKLWALRFKPLQGDGSTLMRLLILSRNMTRDRSWDAILRLDGVRTNRPVADNRPLRDLLLALPGMAVAGVDEPRRILTNEIAEDLRHTKWMPPEHCEQPKFAVNGIGAAQWWPEESRRLAIVSPFCDAGTLSELAKLSTERPLLIGRSDQLACVDEETLDRFARVSVLDEQAEAEDGEETRAEEQRGLHAKLFIQEKSWCTRLTIGSGNATAAALRGDRRKPTSNVEVFSIIEGMTSGLGSIEDILGDSGFGRLTRPFERDEVAPPNPAEIAADRTLLQTRRELARAGLRLRCEKVDVESDARWCLSIVPPEGGLNLGGISRVRVWLITLGEGHARDALDNFRSGAMLVIGEPVLVDVTRFVAVEITEQASGRVELFSTGLPVDGMPVERDDAILRWVIDSREAFLRYLRLILAELGDPFSAALAAQDGSGAKGRSADADDEPLLEDLLRSYCAGDGRLDAVERLVARLEASGATGDRGVPDEFLALWQVFRAALGGLSHAR